MSVRKGVRLPLCLVVEEGGVLCPLDYGMEHVPEGPGHAAMLDANAARAYAHGAVTAIRRIARERRLDVRAVAVDAPSDYRRPELALRRSEQALALRGIRFYKTPSEGEFNCMLHACRLRLRRGGTLRECPQAFRLWMRAGFELHRSLRRAGYRCIEIYPQAAVHVLGAAEVHKSKRAGFETQLAAVAEKTGWRSPELEARLRRSVPGARHDRLDAFIAAWIAWLHTQGRAVALGEPPEDAIWIPGDAQTAPDECS